MIQHLIFTFVLCVISLLSNAQSLSDTVEISECDTTYFEPSTEGIFYSANRYVVFFCTDSTLPYLFKETKPDGFYKINSKYGTDFYSVGKLVKGKKEGVWNRYSPNNWLSSTGKYKKGKPIGEQKSFHFESDRLRSVVCYKGYYRVKYEHYYDLEGNEIEKPVFDTIRTLFNNPEYFVKVGNLKEHPTPWFSKNYRFKKSSWIKYFIVITPIVDVENRGRVVNGKKTGTWYSTNFITGTKLVSHFQNDKLNGIQIKYNSDGTIISKSNYHKGRLNGESITYDSNGGIKSKEQYKRNRLVYSETFNEQRENQMIDNKDE